MRGMKQRATRHLGTYYFTGGLLSHITCGHKHATARGAIDCRWKLRRKGQAKNFRIFMAHLGLLPAKILD